MNAVALAVGVPAEGVTVFKKLVTLLVVKIRLPRFTLPVELLNVRLALPPNALALLNCICVLDPPGAADIPVNCEPLPMK